jgi:hypothetical protein
MIRKQVETARLHKIAKENAQLKHQHVYEGIHH